MDVEQLTPSEALTLLERFELLVDDFRHDCKIATWQEMRPLADSLSDQAKIYECEDRGRALSVVGQSWFRCVDLEVRLSVADLKSELRVAILKDQNPPTGGSYRRKKGGRPKLNAGKEKIIREENLSPNQIAKRFEMTAEAARTLRSRAFKSCDS